MRRMLLQWLGWIVLGALVLMASGLLLADHLTPAATGKPGHALPVQPAQTRIDRELAPLLAQAPGKTAVVMLPHGLDAFAVRALSARAAGRSLDLQYYTWHDDLAGSLLAHEAWQAAERGVRVRMLLDDINAVGQDPALMLMDAHPNIELRLYNPFRNRDGPWRLVEMVQRVFSINHRMHNKAWIADGRVAVVGGRNIGDEYFDAARNVNFRDLDLMLAGPAVNEASAIFDRFWNSPSVVPIAALGKRDPKALAAYMVDVEARIKGADAQLYLKRVGGSVGDAMRRGNGGPHWTDGVHVVSDPPVKRKADDRGDWLVTRLLRQLEATRREALLISPYFVPGDGGCEGIEAVRAKGAHVGIVTNSLAANDVPAVHSGYARYRGRLLAAGVSLFEIRRSGRPGLQSLFGSSGASLHTKAFVVDGSNGFVGSFNLDPRSAYLNTEMGVVFDDPVVARLVGNEYARLSSPALSYQVVRDASGDLRWIDRTQSPPEVLDREPDAGWGLRAVARLLGWLPIESQL